MSDYTSKAKIEAHGMLSGLPAAFDAAYYTSMIAAQSPIIDTMLDDRFPYRFPVEAPTAKFPNIGDDPPTPPIIVEITTLWCMGVLYEDLGAQNRFRDGGEAGGIADDYKAAAETLVGKLNESGNAVLLSDGTVLGKASAGRFWSNSQNTTPEITKDIMSRY